MPFVAKAYAERARMVCGIFDPGVVQPTEERFPGPSLTPALMPEDNPLMGVCPSCQQGISGVLRKA